MHSEFELKVLSEIDSMKNEIDTLKQAVFNLNEKMKKTHKVLDTPNDKTERMSINSVRDYIKGQLINRNTKLRFTNGNRAIGKLTISNGVSIIEKIMIRASKSFREKEGYPSGWFTIHRDQLEQYDLFFLVVKDFRGELYTLIMNENEINNWVGHKSTDSNGNYHFYVNLIQGKWIDDREGEYDCTSYYNNWGLIENMLQKGEG
ncbi:hypothetical protein [Paenibacillus amylolyticus]|uniref:Uncharacterized protein n=1 Tax=Paenibacillus amylolyticus TaxID=1451 RepID=A0A100VPN6_PAEAM|nr:hypothetical protein [Paenibacillus amylolyticus]GAS83753.1 unknown protein [Paenibacillus amylolyticus]